MKKTFKLFVVVLSILLLTGCGKDKGYNLIELTGSELIFSATIVKPLL